MAALLSLTAITITLIIVIGGRGSSPRVSPTIREAAAPLITGSISNQAPGLQPTRAKVRVRTIIRTVTTAAAPVTTAAAPVTSVLPKASPPNSPAGMSSCEQNVRANGVTSCTFADNVFRGYAVNVRRHGTHSVTEVAAYSPATGRSYTDVCDAGPDAGIVRCSHGTDLVLFPLRAAQVYRGSR